MSENISAGFNPEELTADIRALLLEAAVGPENPRETWFADNEDGSGLLGSVRSISAKAAFAVPAEGLDCIAAHVQHATYSMNLAIRAYRGENPYESADWSGSWVIREKSPELWNRILNDLEAAVNNLNGELTRGINLSDPMLRRGSLGLIAHTAWHLGAVRQLLVLAA
jgi:hypothetical protein